MSEQKTGDRMTNDLDGDAVEMLSGTLNSWRARIDELLVQADLAGHEVRDRVRKHVDIAENVYLAARSRLSDARRDAHEDVKTVRSGTERLVSDLQQAFEAAEAALRRGRTA
jgi:hypothetical protein